MMREAHLSGSRQWPTADQSSAGYRVVWRAEWTDSLAHSVAVQNTRNGMNCDDLQRFVFRQRRQNGWQSTREHRFACSRRTDEQHVVTASRGNLQRPLRRLLSDDIGEIASVVAGCLANGGDIRGCRGAVSKVLHELSK